MPHRTTQQTRPATASEQRPSVFAVDNSCPVARSAYRKVVRGVGLQRADGARLLVLLDAPVIVETTGYEATQGAA